MKFSISPKLIESCKSSSSKYKNDLVEKAKLAEQEAKAKKMDLEAKEKQAKKKNKIECIEADIRYLIFAHSLKALIFMSTLFFYKHQLNLVQPHLWLSKLIFQP